MKTVNYSAFIAAVVLVAFYLPFGSVPPADGLDPSWQQAIAHGLAQGMQFGRDIVFTYGPLGSLYVNSGGAQLQELSMLLWGALILTMVFVITGPLLPTDPPRSWIRLWALLPLLVTPSRDGFALCLFFCVACRAERIVLRSELTVFVSLVMGSLALCKFTLGVAGLCALVPLSMASYWQHSGWRRYAPGPAYFMGFLGAWLAAGQDLGSLAPFVLNDAQVAAGYSAAMGKSGPDNELIIGALLFCILVCHLVLKLRPHLTGITSRAGILALTTTMALVFMAWLAFKQGFVRHDGEHVSTYLAFTGSALLISLLDPEKQIPRKTVFTSTLLWATLCFLGSSLPHHGQGSVLGRTWLHISQQWNGLQELRGKASSGDLRKTRLVLMSASALPAVDATVDIASIDLSWLFASSLKWSPRPVIQSYSAYTPSLARLNGDHMTSDLSAPRHFFVSIAPIDGHIALQEDPLLWPELVTRYELVTTDPIPLLSRLKTQRSITTRQITPAQHDGYWHLPADARYDFARLNIAPAVGVAKALLAIALRPKAILLETRLSNGETRKAPFMASLGGTYFILSPYVESNADFAMLNRSPGSLPEKRVVAFRLIDGAGNPIGVKTAPTVELTNVDMGRPV
ncbi:hypothetical protein VVD49_08640 [Uliginosibacterium sp. H3]|uniref:Transmembrane protein n=1 Tax=Uliginosibacterium silvisoli TaxID=3114758 RepID=A0ABU6K2C7_9RHOO|nr:hypothetical protein [Uliginosibacterium sp. H3]